MLVIFLQHDRKIRLERKRKVEEAEWRRFYGRNNKILPVNMK